MKEDAEYYTQLHETSRTYQIALWAVPSVFLVLQGVLFNNFSFDKLLSLRDCILLLFDALFSFSLWIQFQKTYAASRILQKRINEIDASYQGRKPMYDFGGEGLVGEVKGYKDFYWELKQAIRLSAARWTAWLMLVFSIFAFVLFLKILSNL